MRLLSAALLAPAALHAASTPAAPAPSEADETARLDELAFRTYLYARIGDKENALKTGDEVFARDPHNVVAILALASMWEAEGEPERAYELAAKLIADKPTHDQALYFKAYAESSLRRDRAARRSHLDNIAANFSHGEKFPYYGPLAESAQLVGDWRTAVRARREIIENSGDYAMLARNRKLYDILLREKSPEISSSVSLFSAPMRFDSTRLSLAYATPVLVSTRIRLETTYTESHMTRAEGWRSDSRGTAGALAGVNYSADALTELDATAGADTTGSPSATAGAAWHTTKSRRFALTGEAYTAAEDDPRFLIANIRQTRVLASYEDLWTERTGGRVSLGPRSLHTLDAGPTDWGWMFSGEVFHHSRQRIPHLTPYLQTLWLQNPSSPSVTRAFDAFRADGRQADLTGLFDLEKLGVRVEIPLHNRWVLASDAYTGTSFIHAGIFYGVSGEVSCQLTKTLSLRGGAGWENGNVFGDLPYGLVRARASLGWSF